jgi:hypothetical protein
MPGIAIAVVKGKGRKGILEIAIYMSFDSLKIYCSGLLTFCFLFT